MSGGMVFTSSTFLSAEEWNAGWRPSGGQGSEKDSGKHDYGCGMGTAFFC